jgi:hypothetical protein
MFRRVYLSVALGAALGVAGCDKETLVAPALVAACSATPSTGPAPLVVTFRLDVAGAEGNFNTAVDYGDGTQGTDPGRAHTYTSPGSYNAVFSVTTASQSARCTAGVTATPGTTPTPTPSPSPAQNSPPEPTFRTEPAAVGGVAISGRAPLTVSFDLCRTVDPDGDRLYFQMDLDGDGAFEYHGATGTDCRHDRTYSAGTVTPLVCVTDVACPFWPSCEGTGRLHSPLCRAYSVTALP